MAQDRNPREAEERRRLMTTQPRPGPPEPSGISRPQLPELLANRADTLRDRAAIVVVGVGAFSFLDWHRRSRDYVAALAEHAVPLRSRVLLRFADHDWFEYAAAFMGCVAYGAVAVPVPASLTDHELSRLAELCAPSHLLAINDSRAIHLTHVEGLPRDDIPPVHGGSERPRADSTVQLLYTSGTSGIPKCVAATHSNLIQGYDWQEAPDVAQSPPGAIFHAFPIGTNAGQSYLVGTLFDGLCRVIAPSFVPGRFFATASEHNVTVACFTPTLARLVLRAAARAGHAPYESMASIGLTGSAAAPSLLRDLQQLFPRATITNYYTSTEAWPALVAMDYDPRRPAALGRPLGATSVVVRNDRGQNLDPNALGEIWLHHADAPPRSYWETDGRHNATFVDGWTGTGDIGYLDADGYLFLVDRKSDTVNIHGSNVSTVEVEFALTEHPAVEDAAVVGLGDLLAGQELGAAVVLSQVVQTAELDTFLRTRLASYKVPTSIVVMQELPRTASGKVQKSLIAEALARGPLATRDEFLRPSPTTTPSL